MGLIVTKSLMNGLVITDAYVRIDTIMGSKNSIEYSVVTYSSRQHFLNDKLPIDNIEHYSFKPEIKAKSENFLRQAFYDLKKKPQYIEAVDIFEEGQ